MRSFVRISKVDEPTDLVAMGASIEALSEKE